MPRAAAERPARASGDVSGLTEPKRFSPMGRWDVCVAHRRFCDDYTAHWLALRRAAQMYVVGAGTGRTFKVIWHGTDAPGCGRHTCGGTAGRLPTGSYVGRLPIGSYVLFGLLAGLSAALGFLVPPRSRVTAVH